MIEQQLMTVVALAYYSAKLEPVTHKRMLEIMAHAGMDSADIVELYNLADSMVMETTHGETGTDDTES